MEIFIYILLVYGITNIVVQGTLLDPAKLLLLDLAVATKNQYIKYICIKTHKLVGCYMCLSFWVGMFLGLFIGPLTIWVFPLNGFFYSGTTWIIACFVQFLGNGYDPSRTINIVIGDEPSIKVKVYANGTKEATKE